MIIDRYKTQKERRKIRTRASLAGSDRARLVIFRSNKYVYAQVVDRGTGKTLTGVRGRDAKAVGGEIAKKVVKLGVKEAVFDRGGYKYHGKTKALAEGAREGGLKI